MTNKTSDSNFERRVVISKPKSGVRVIELELSTKGKKSLSSKSPGIRSSLNSDKDKKKADIDDHPALSPC